MHQKLSLLGRVRRLRSVERRKALLVLADARAEYVRMTDLARRSGAIAADYSPRGNAMHGREIATRAHFGCQMDALARSAQTMGQTARVAADAAGTHYARAERNLEEASERLLQAQSHINAKTQQRVASSASGLARRLQTDGEYDGGRRATHQTGDQL